MEYKRLRFRRRSKACEVSKLYYQFITRRAKVSNRSSSQIDKSETLISEGPE